MKKLFALLLAAILLVAGSSSLAAAAPTVYKVEDQSGNRIYLFGTIHAVKQGIYEEALPFGEALEEAYAYADVLAVELDILAAMQNAQQSAAMDDLMYSDGTTVLDHGVSEELLNAFAEQLGLPAEVLLSIKLSLWPSLLLGAAVAELNMDIENSVDAWLLQRAYADGKQIIELETMDEQEEIIGGMSDELVVYTLKDALENPYAAAEELQLLYEAWSNGDAQALRDGLAGSGEDEALQANLAEDAEAYNSVLTTNRDDEFYQDAVGFLERGEKVLIAIGALHIIGETGIANRLMDAGYTVTDISR